MTNSSVGKTRREYGRVFKLEIVGKQRCWVNTSNGDVRVIPPVPGSGSTAWQVRALSTSHRSTSMQIFNEPNAEDRAFAHAALIIANIAEPHHDS